MDKTKFVRCSFGSGGRGLCAEVAFALSWLRNFYAEGQELRLPAALHQLLTFLREEVAVKRNTEKGESGQAFARFETNYFN